MQANFSLLTLPKRGGGGEGGYGTEEGYRTPGESNTAEASKDCCSQFVVALCLYTRKGIIILRLTAP